MPSVWAESFVYVVSSSLIDTESIAFELNEMHLTASFKLGSTYSPPTFKVILLSPTNSNVSSFWIILQVIKAPIAPTTKNITINKTVTGWFFLYDFSALLTTFLAFLLLIPVVLLILFAASFLFV